MADRIFTPPSDDYILDLSLEENSTSKPRKKVKAKLRRLNSTKTSGGTTGGGACTIVH